MKKIITMLFVCVSSLGYGAQSDAFNADVSLPALAGEDQLSDVAVLAVPVSMGVFEGLPSGGRIDEVHSYVSGAQDGLGFVNFQEPVVLPAPAFVTFGPKQAADNALEKGQKRDNADESEHDSKRMRFNLPAPGLTPAPFFMDGFEDLRSDEIDPGNFYFCGIQGCFACFSTIEDRTDHEMRVHAQGYSQAPGFQVFQEDGNGDMMMAQDGLGSVSLQQPVVVPEPAPVQRSIDIQPGQTLCHVCDKGFRSHSALIIHMRTHTGERPYACSYEGCGKAFTQSDHLKSHMRIHAGEKPYACSYKDCDSRFAQKQHLKKHMRTHTGERPYVCSYEGCGKAFTQSEHLKGHSRIHSREKLYACSYEGCDKAFTQSNHLKGHSRIHSEEKPYVCSYEGCGKVFTQNSNLKSHMKIHEQVDKDTSA